MLKTLFSICLLLASTLLCGQATLSVSNPSFEDEPRHSYTPAGWFDCGFVDKSPPDVGPTKQFRSTVQAIDGKSFLVLITRDDNTWERVGATLSDTLRAGQAYQLNLQLTRSASYFSQSPVVGKEVNFAFPVKLRLWSARTPCESLELLAETPPVSHLDWQSYTLSFQALQPATHIILEAYYDGEAQLPYPGNLCLDGLSAITPLDSIPDYKRPQAATPLGTPTNESLRTPRVNPIDQAYVRTLLDAIQPNLVEQGLYDLAVYQRSLNQGAWIIYVKNDGTKASRKLKRAIRKQIAALNLEAHLSVDDYVSAFQSMEWLSTPVDGGLGLKER